MVALLLTVRDFGQPLQALVSPSVKLGITIELGEGVGEDVFKHLEQSLTQSMHLLNK